MMRGKGDTYQKGYIKTLIKKRKGARVKVQRVIIKGENEALLTTGKRYSPGMKKGHLLTEMGHPSH